MLRAPWALLLVGVLGCGRGGALVTILNESPDTLRNVVPTGTGFADTLQELSPRQLAAVRVRPRGESGIGVAFTSGERRVSVPEQEYFEGAGGYVVLVKVDSTLRVSTQVTLQR
jgi:hypothetical protein